MAGPLEGQGAAVDIEDLPTPILEGLLHQLSLTELAVICCVSSTWRRRALGRLQSLDGITLQDFKLFPLVHNYLLLGGEKAMRHRVLNYFPQVFHWISRHCRSLRQLHLELPTPPMPVSVAAGRAAAAEAFPVMPQAQAEFPPVDGFLIKLLAQGCPHLRSLRFVNLTNNRALNRLVHINDAFLSVLAKSCPELEDLNLGHLGGESESIYNLVAAYYCEDVSDAGIKAVAKGCTNLRSLGLLRCNKVSDEGLAMVAHYCRRLEGLKLHDCPEISDSALVEVAESCSRLRSLDVTVARRVSGLLLGEEAEGQLGFRAMFTVAANCPLLEELLISEAALDSPALDDDSMLVVAQGCRRLRRLELRHCSGISDVGMRAIANLCKDLEELTLEHTGVGDAGILAVAKGCPLRHLRITNHNSLNRLSLAPVAAGEGRGAPRGISDAALRHVADHCRALEELSITGSRMVTDAGLLYLAQLNHAALHRRLRQLAINHTGATEAGVCALLARCGGLRSLGVRGLLFSADNTMACISTHLQQLKSIDLRHCSTLSDAGLACLGEGCPFLEDLCASFCGRLTDEGVLRFAAAMGRRLRRLELYHVPLLTQGAVVALAARCGTLQQLNLGKCGAITALAGRGGFLVQGCHYLDY